MAEAKEKIEPIKDNTKVFDLAQYRESDQAIQMKAELAEYDRQIEDIRRAGGNIKQFIKVKLLERLGGVNYLANFILRYEADLKDKIVDLFIDDTYGANLTSLEDYDVGSKKKRKGKKEAGNITFNIGSMIKTITKEEEEEPKLKEIVDIDKPIDVVLVEE
jgi:hypothetical protein